MLKVFSWVLAANLARQLAFLAVNGILFERLSRATFGDLTLAFSYMAVFVGLGDFGIGQIGWRTIARRPQDVGSITGAHLGARTVSVSFALVAYLLVMPLLWASGSSSEIYVLYGLGIVLNQGTFDFVLYGMQRMDLYARYAVVAFTVFLVACVLFVHEDAQAMLVPCFFVGSMALLLGLQVRWFLKNRPDQPIRLALGQFRSIASQSWPLGLGGTLSRLVAKYPVILIGFLVGSGGAGDYRIAEVGYAFLAQFGQLIATSGYTNLAYLHQHQRSQLARAFKRVFFAIVGGAFVAGAGLAIAGPWVLNVVFGDVAPGTVTVLRILGLALVFAAPARLLKGLLATVDLQWILPPANILTIAVSSVVGWLAVSRFGIAGMAAAVLAAEALTFAFLVTFYWKELRD